jgi:hypothetical protein
LIQVESRKGQLEKHFRQGGEAFNKGLISLRETIENGKVDILKQIAIGAE